MSVTLAKTVKLIVNSQAAKPGPAIGQALGPLGLNMADFCKQFNEKSKVFEKDIPIPVLLSAFSNRTFTFKVKTPSTSWFVKRCVGIELGSGTYVIMIYNVLIIMLKRGKSILKLLHKIIFNNIDNADNM